MTNSVDPDNLTFLLKKHPEVVLGQQTDLMEFLANTHNIVPREDFFCVLVSVFILESRLFHRHLFIPSPAE